MGTMCRFLLHCTHGKVEMVDLGESWLVVIFDQFADTQLAQDEVDRSAELLRKHSQIG